MPKKRKVESNLTRLIKGLGLSLSDFARTIGVSTSIIKKVAEGKRPMSQELQTRIFAETGVFFVPTETDEGADPLVYTKDNHREFKQTTEFNEAAAKMAAATITKQVELLLLAASRPTVGKSMPVFTALNLALEKIKDEYRLEGVIDNILRERHATETRLYLVKDLRANNLLANQVGFKDNPAYKDDDKIPLAKTIGWFPAKDLFNVTWQNRQFLGELLISEVQNQTLTEEQKQQLEQMNAQLEREIDAFIPNLKSSEPESK